MLIRLSLAHGQTENWPKTARFFAQVLPKFWLPHRPDEGRKRVLAIVAGILVARYLKTADDLFEKASPRTEAMVAAAVQWAERIMRKIDNVFGCERQR